VSPAYESRKADRLERLEERLVADVERVRSGAVRVEKRVVEEPDVVDVALRHDEVELERLPADRPLDPDEQPIAVHGDETTVLVIEERVDVRKVPWVVEEIHIRRRAVTETTRIEDTVRRERWEISSEGDVDLEHRE
jgi:uncharacterized protein (TIGR02271 family)